MNDYILTVIFIIAGFIYKTTDRKGSWVKPSQCFIQSEIITNSSLWSRCRSHKGGVHMSVYLTFFFSFRKAWVLSLHCSAFSGTEIIWIDAFVEFLESTRLWWPLSEWTRSTLLLTVHYKLIAAAWECGRRTDQSLNVRAPCWWITDVD